mmetsp:Transcript_11623/g.10390  ORF Transcript_11623/g.10390 Transcript_11623/m.10390 type:complete len:117 (+) Transcript_11623:71-421(+)
MGCCMVHAKELEDPLVMIKPQMLFYTNLGERQREILLPQIILYSNCLMYQYDPCCCKLCKTVMKTKFGHILNMSTRNGDIIIQTIDGKRIIFGPNTNEINDLIEKTYKEYIPFIQK